MSKFDEMSDGDLATLAIGGKQAAYRVLLDRHRNAVFRIARHHCGEDDGALDVTQQTFISAFAALIAMIGRGPSHIGSPASPSTKATTGPAAGEFAPFSAWPSHWTKLSR
jgi:hypothetical protein